MKIPYGNRMDFLEYCWEHYGPNGHTPVKGLTKEMMSEACDMIRKYEPDWQGANMHERQAALVYVMQNHPEIEPPELS